MHASGTLYICTLARVHNTVQVQSHRCESEQSVPLPSTCLHVPGMLKQARGHAYARVRPLLLDFSSRRGEEGSLSRWGSGSCSSGASAVGGGAVLTDIDECLSNPCVNGVCRNLAGSYACECAPGSRLGPSGTVCLGERPHGATRAPTPRGVSWVFVGLCAGVGPPGERVGPSPQTAPKAPAG